MSRLQWALLAGGAILFVVLVVEVGPGAVLASFATLSWWLPIIIVFPFCLVTAFDTLGWKFAFRRDRVSFVALLTARMAGEAFNATTPTASVGGEAVKAWLLRAQVALDESLPSVIVAKTTITVSQALFLLLGIAVAWPTLPAGSTLLWAMKWLLVLEILGVGGFVAAQVAGGVGIGGRLLRRFGVAGTGPEGTLGRLDHALTRFYRDEPRRLCLSIACHFLGWAFSALEAWVILNALGLHVSFLTAVVIEAFGTGIRFASFMIPAHLGALEGGHVAIFGALGLSAPAALSFSLARRVRELAWTALGLAMLTGLGGRRPVLGALGPEA